MTRAEAEAVARLIVPSPLYFWPAVYIRRTGSRSHRFQVTTHRRRDVPDPVTGASLVLIRAMGADWIEALRDLAAKLAADDRR